jgi:hypothetical protein
MSGQKNEIVKYDIEIHQAQGTVIGDYAHVEQHFHTAPPPPPPSC